MSNENPSIFAIGTHKDLKECKEHFFKQLKPFVSITNYYDLSPGSDSYEEAHRQIDAAQFVLCIVSSNWQEEDINRECPNDRLLKYAISKKKVYIPIHWRTYTGITLIPEFAKISPLPKGEKAFMSIGEIERDDCAAEMARAILDKINKPSESNVPTYWFDKNVGNNPEAKQQLCELILSPSRREVHKHGFYFEREHDQKLRQYLAHQKHCLVEGNPLAGKTCSVFEALCQLEYPFNLYPVPMLNDDDPKPLETINKLPQDHYLIAFFDDIQNYIRKAPTLSPQVFEALINRPKTIVIATCRTGDEFNSYQELDEQYRASLKEIHIDLITEAQETQLLRAIEAERKNNPHFETAQTFEQYDHNIGSLFVEIKGMKERYGRIKKEQYENDKNSDKAWVAMQLFEALFVFYMACNFEASNTYNLQKIKAFCKLKAQKEDEENEDEYKTNTRRIINHWNAAVEHIDSGMTNQNFIRTFTQNTVLFLQTEEIYIEKIFRLEKIKPADTYYEIKQRIYNLYDHDIKAIKEAGFYNKQIGVNLDLKHAKSLDDARQILKDAKKARIPLDEISYNTLINKSDRFTDAKFFFDEMKAAGLRPNEISYNTLINKSDRFTDAKFFFDEMKAAGLRLDEISYNTLINKRDLNFERAKPYYEEFLQKFPLRKNNARSEKNYSYLFITLFRKIRTREQWAFVKSEVDRLGLLPFGDYAQKIYNDLLYKWWQ